MTISFSEPINPSTLSSSTLSLFNGATQIGESISYGADGRSVVLSTTFPANANISVVVTSGVKDLSGNAIANFNSSFTTAADIPANGPSVTNQRPTGSGIPIDSPVTVVFNRAMNASSTVAALRVSENGLLKAGNTVLSTDGLSLVFTPSTPYAYGAVIQIFVTQAATDLTGLALGNTYANTFRAQPPASSSSPAPRRPRRAPFSAAPRRHRRRSASRGCQAPRR